MKKTRVDAYGRVICPKCGAVGSFSAKRSVKGKLMAGVLAPKRLKCNGCGTLLKTN